MCLAETLSRIIHVFGQPQVQHVVVYLCIYCKYVYKSYMPTRMFKYICIQKKNDNNNKGCKLRSILCQLVLP